MPASWEVSSGVSSAYKMAGQGNTCFSVKGPRNSSVINFRVQDAMSIGLCMNGDSPKGTANCRLVSAHDTVTVMGSLSALSLHEAHYQHVDVNANSEESRCELLAAISYESPKANKCASPCNKQSLTVTFAPTVICGSHSNGSLPLSDPNVVRSSDVHSEAFGDGSGSVAFSNGGLPFCDMDMVQRSESHSKAFGNGSVSILNSGSSHNMTVSPYHGEMARVSSSVDRQFSSSSILSDSSTESGPVTDGFDLDTISESSSLSNNDIPADSSSSGDLSQVLDDSEVQSPYQGGNVSPVEELSNRPRRGISKFYAGKSRSFSCLRDVVSVKDLAKPESPYPKKRKMNSNNSRLPPLQKGSATISKRLTQSCKSTLALAVAMSAKQENEPQASYATMKSLVPSRSYSLSDLQGAAGRGSLFFIG